MGFSRLIRPVARAAKGERYAMPGDGNAVLELAQILRVDLGAERDRALHSLGWRHRRELVRVRSIERISAEQHALAARVEIRAGIGNLSNREIGVGDPAKNVLVLLPESTRELQPELHRGSIRNSVDRRLHPRGHVDRDLAQDAQRNRAYAPVGPHFPDRPAAGKVLELDGDAAVILPDGDDFRAISNS